MENDGNQPQSEEGDDFLKSTPENYVPVAVPDEEGETFRSLDELDDEEEEEEDGFLRKRAVESATHFKPEVANEADQFRDFEEIEEDENGGKETDAKKQEDPKAVVEDKKDENAETEKKESIEDDVKPKVEDVRYHGPPSTSPSSSSHLTEKSTGVSLTVECGCCECCPYHDAAQKGEAESKKHGQESRRSSKERRRSSKKDGASKGSKKRDRQRKKSSDKVQSTRKTGNRPARPSQIMSNLFTSLLPSDNDEERVTAVCSGFANALLGAGVLANERNETEESTE